MPDLAHSPAKRQQLLLGLANHHGLDGFGTQEAIDHGLPETLLKQDLKEIMAAGKLVYREVLGQPRQCTTDRS